MTQSHHAVLYCYVLQCIIFRIFVHSVAEFAGNWGNLKNGDTTKGSLFVTLWATWAFEENFRVALIFIG